MFKKRKRKQRKNLLETLDNKLQELNQYREDLEARVSAAQDLEDKKSLVQQSIDLTHQIQALRVVLELYTVDE